MKLNINRLNEAISRLSDPTYRGQISSMRVDGHMIKGVHYDLTLEAVPNATGVLEWEIVINEG